MAKALSFSRLITYLGRDRDAEFDRDGLGAIAPGGSNFQL